MWTIETTDTFDLWFDAQIDADRTSILATLMVLQEKGHPCPGHTLIQFMVRCTAI